MPSVPPALGAVADRAILKVAALRFPDMRSFADALQAALADGSQGRRDALRNLATPAVPARAPLPRTQPMSAFAEPPPAAERAPLARTAPQGGALPFAVTAAARTAPGEVPTPATVRTSLPSQMSPVGSSPPGAGLVPPPPPRRKRVSPVLVLAAVLAVALGLAGGAWVAMRFLQ